jgi:putative transposase
MATVVDQLSRDSPLIEVDFPLSGQKVAPAVDRRLVGGPLLISLTMDDGTELISKGLEKWLGAVAVQMDFTRAGKPMDSGHIESFNGRLRDDRPSVNQFLALDVASATIEAWRLDYNHHRPHGSLGYLTPSDSKVVGTIGARATAEVLLSVVSEWGQRRTAGNSTHELSH